MRRLVWVVFLSNAALLAHAAEIPLTNWTVPPYRGSSASGGLTTMADISPGVGFVAVQPCRIVDTRGGGVFTGTYGPPALVANATRSFDINSAAHCTGIPVGVDAYSLNFTVVNTTGGPGDLRAWPTGNPPVQTTSVLNWTAANVIIANATIIGAGTGGSIDVTAAGFGTHLLIDINGYFTDQYNPGVSFHSVSANVAPAILGENTSTAANAVAVEGVITAATPGAFATGVRGISNGYGVYGSSTNGFGVVATTGGTGPNSAVWARNTSTGAGASGVYGSVVASSLIRNYGVFGETTSIQVGSAGVFGRDGSGVIPGTQLSAGVRGESRESVGVLGMTENFEGVTGRLIDPTTGISVVSGHLGYQGPTDYGVYSQGPAYVSGNLTVGGTISAAMKPFIQPHPHDPSKQIRYVSLEGPHSEVYFRGTAQISRGVTRIAIPEDFRLVADGGTYSTLVTPVGAMATVAVLSEGEEGIVVQASRDVRVHYVVYAEREAMRNPEPIIENVDFRPEPDSDSLRFLPEPYRRLMIQNGTLKPDGTVNVETARRLGWDKEWEKRARPAPQPAPE